MKKILSCFLIALLLLSLGITAHAESPDDVIFTPFVNVSKQIGETVGPDGYHSGHQTRLVHTTHGDYIAIMTERLKDDDENIQINEISLIKVENGVATLLYQDYQSYCTSSINIFQDDNGEVYASSVLSNKYDTYSAEDSVSIAVWHIDAKTDAVNAYKTTIPTKEPASYGYAQPVIDTKKGKIYAVLSRGNGNNDGYLHWFIFDLKTMSWEPNEYKIECHEKWRYMYHYLFPDGKGGLYIVTQRNALAEPLGYPEIPNNPKWPASYVWDAMAYYYIPNVYDDSDFTFMYIEEPDYSRIHDLDGDGQYTSMDERMTNQYPTVVNNHQGDAYLDSKGILHVLYTVGYNQCAYDRSVCFESLMYHVAYDLTDPRHPRQLCKDQLFLDYAPAKNVNYAYEFRMTEGLDGTLFMVAGDQDESVSTCLELFEMTPQADGSYVYTKRGISDSGYTSWGLSLSNLRSNSTIDGTASVLVKVHGNDEMAVTTVTLPGPADLGIAINNINFPDDAFRAYISANLDLDHNTYLSASEIARIVKLDVSNKGIASLKGIEFFTALEELNCSYNLLTELDVSRNTALKALNCGHNQLTSLDVDATAVADPRSVVTEANTYAVTMADGKNTFDLTKLPGSFDVTKASNWKGGTVKGNILTLDNGSTTVTYDYDCGKDVIASFTLTMDNALPALVITQQPAAVNVKAGEDATFSVTVEGGKDPYAYQWQKLDKDGSWADIRTARTIGQSELTLKSVSKDDNGAQYRCVISDAVGNTVTSEIATLSVWSDLPTTGDESQPILWAMMVLVAGAALIMMKRRQDA